MRDSLFGRGIDNRRSRSSGSRAILYHACNACLLTREPACSHLFFAFRFFFLLFSLRFWGVGKILNLPVLIIICSLWSSLGFSFVRMLFILGRPNDPPLYLLFFIFFYYALYITSFLFF